MRGWILLIGVMLSTPAAAADQFDLVCSGTRITKMNGPAEPFKFGFRVDLAAKQWCWDHCEKVFPIVNVFPDRIIFQDKEDDTRSARSMNKAEINRSTGQYESTWIEVYPYPTYWKTEGLCEVSSFSGFPTAKF